MNSREKLESAVAIALATLDHISRGDWNAHTLPRESKPLRRYAGEKADTIRSLLQSQGVQDER